ncbi:MAG: 50S ribosomal protein L24 [Candidatus Aureabacteria bacterium]|nr:50S ribosomal protein L24 [Candidatus Auribacterota bacterium]
MVVTKLKKNDEIRVIAGKDKGKTGKILKIFKETNRVLVQGINFIKKHKKPTQNDRQGGIVQEERPIHLSKVMLLCSSCKKPTRVGRKFMESGEKIRFCKMCNADL